MTFLLDTNVVSEWKKPAPDASVVAWLANIDEDRTFLSVVTLAELRYGIDRLPDGKRRNLLDHWLTHDLPMRFESRILSVDPAVADAWGIIIARRAAMGRPISAMDAFMAATAQVHNLTLVTRNVSDFEASVASIVNPWTRPPSA
ncbi:type II toxin-antitoxin system VapC family toxin [Inquilinus sp. Marseille-Q2685]|uniref:type II toxin-antitoxin system VapC family toxin n=1 Tax=Inquilinus sp. Marseille-Q2685 TaxID=2866581 RepID=UPI001CE48DD7|nr:type II toxin-antitoxin system VapC family toxin [Inquilinus sp. Marseille-Q2685]